MTRSFERLKGSLPPMPFHSNDSEAGDRTGHNRRRQKDHCPTLTKEESRKTNRQSSLVLIVPTLFASTIEDTVPSKSRRGATERRLLWPGEALRDDETMYPFLTATESENGSDYSPRIGEPKGVMREIYGDLADHLRPKFQIEPFPWDWRNSLTDSVRSLRRRLQQPRNPVTHVVAHGPGALIVRLALAGLRASKVRVVEIAPPYGGTWWAAHVVTGDAEVTNVLRTRSPDMTRLDENRLFAAYGMIEAAYELLPVDKVDDDLLDSEYWKSRHRVAVAADWLDGARLFRDRLAKAAVGEQVKVSRIVGTGQTTPSAFGGEKQSRLQVTDAGDGFVTLRSALADADLGRCYAVGASHMSMMGRIDVVRAVRDLLSHDTTLRLSPAEIPDDDAPRSFLYQLRRSETPFDVDRARKRILELMPRPRKTTHIDVRVVHGHLRGAENPLLVGHYENDAIVSAEKAVDRHFDRALSRSHRVGQYPGRIGTHERFVKHDVDPENGTPDPLTAIVIGLGPLGTLSAKKARTTIVTALFDYARCRLEAEPVPTNVPLELGVSSLLLGTGQAIGLETSLRVLVEAVAETNDAIERFVAPLQKNRDDRNDSDSPGDDAAGGPVAPENDRGTDTALATKRRHARFNSIEIIEVEERLAARAHAAMRDFENAGRFESMRIKLDVGELETAPGFRAAANASSRSAWWPCMVVRCKNGLIEFRTTSSSTLDIDDTSMPFDAKLLEGILADLDGGTHTFDPNIPTLLWRSFAPPAIDHDLAEGTGVRLVLDERSLDVPWELMSPAPPKPGSRPLFAKLGLVRQLAHTTDMIPPECAPDSAFIIVDTKITEAEEIVRELRGKFEQHTATRVTDSKNMSPRDVKARLGRGRPPGIVHVLTHGVKGGDALLGDDHSLTSRFLCDGTHVPSLVFLQACSLGGASPVTADGRRATRGLGRDLLKAGVRTVIMAAWPIDVEPSRTFANTFYDAYLSGTPFGQAVVAAREETWRCHQSNAWAAFQCYGDPDHVMKSTQETEDTPEKEVVVPNRRALFDRIYQLHDRSRHVREPKRCKSVRRELTLVADELVTHPEWDDGEVRSTLAGAFAQSGAFGDAVRHYLHAIRHPKGRGFSNELETFANMWQRSKTMAAVRAATRIRAFEERRSAKLDIRAPRARKKVLEEALESALGEAREACDMAESLLAGVHGILRTSDGPLPPRVAWHAASVAKRRAVLAHLDNNAVDRDAILRIAESNYDDAVRLADAEDRPRPWLVVNRELCKWLRGGYSKPTAKKASRTRIRQAYEEWRRNSKHRNRPRRRDYYDLALPAEVQLLRHLMADNFKPRHAGKIGDLYQAALDGPFPAIDIQSSLEQMVIIHALTTPTNGRKRRSSGGEESRRVERTHRSVRA